MKKMIVIGLMLASMPVFAQKLDASKVPAPVKTTFSKNFPGTQDVKWEQEKGNYEATFKKDGQKLSATFDKNGGWLETEKAISVTALPTAASAYLEKNCKGKVAKAASVITLVNGDTNYEAEINGKDYIFDGKGNFIKSEKD